MSNIERAVAVIADQLPKPIAEHESSTDYKNGLAIVRDVAGRAAEALHAAGLLKADLPGQDGCTWETFAEFSLVYIDSDLNDTYLSPTEARDLASDLIAAAEEADRE